MGRGNKRHGLVAAGVSLEPAPRKGVRTPVPTTSGNNGEKRHGEAKTKALEDGKQDGRSLPRRDRQDKAGVF